MTFLIVSPSWSESNSGWYGGKTFRLGEHKAACFCPTFGSRLRLLRMARVLCSLVWLFMWLLLHVRRGEKVIAYHAPWMGLPLVAARSLRRFKLVLEVEEEYHKIARLPLPLAIAEALVVNRADMYIFPNEIMPGRVGRPSREHVVVHGVYATYQQLSKPEEDGKVHLVYAGAIQGSRPDAFNALQGSRFLGDRYVLHILGFGDIASLRQAINRVTTSGGCKVICEGTKSGDDFVASMQRYHIGLSTHRASGAYPETSFPSKILSYMSLGLRVVSADLKCVTGSRVADLITYYSEDTPEAIADAIRRVNMEDAYDPTERLRELHGEFVKQIADLLAYPQVALPGGTLGGGD